LSLAIRLVRYVSSAGMFAASLFGYYVAFSPSGQNPRLIFLLLAAGSMFLSQVLLFSMKPNPWRLLSMDLKYLWRRLSGK